MQTSDWYPYRNAPFVLHPYRARLIDALQLSPTWQDASAGCPATSQTPTYACCPERRLLFTKQYLKRSFVIHPMSSLFIVTPLFAMYLRIFLLDRR
jgi:hypothetical protein